MKITDRRVHAKLGLVEVVRYDRAGKWYLENGNTGKREACDIRRAAAWAVTLATQGGEVYTGMPGGSTFDRMVK